MRDIIFALIIGGACVYTATNLFKPVVKVLPDYMWVCNKPTVAGSTYCTPQPATNYEVK